MKILNIVLILLIGNNLMGMQLLPSLSSAQLLSQQLRLHVTNLSSAGERRMIYQPPALESAREHTEMVAEFTRISEEYAEQMIIEAVDNQRSFLERQHYYSAMNSVLATVGRMHEALMSLPDDRPMTPQKKCSDSNTYDDHKKEILLRAFVRLRGDKISLLDVINRFSSDLKNVEELVLPLEALKANCCKQPIEKILLASKNATLVIDFSDTIEILDNVSFSFNPHVQHVKILGPMVQVIGAQFLSGWSGIKNIDLSSLTNVKEIKSGFLLGCSGLSCLDLTALRYAENISLVNVPRLKLVTRTRQQSIDLNSNVHVLEVMDDILANNPRRAGSDYTSLEFGLGSSLMQGANQSEEGYLDQLKIIFSHDRAWAILADILDGKDLS